MKADGKSEEAGAVRIDHVEMLAANDSTYSFRDILEWLLPPPIAGRDLVELFDRRATFAAIKSWRFGQCAPPQWAIEILDRKLAARIAAIEARRQALPHCAGPGSGWNKNATRGLGEWRAKKNLQQKD